MKANTKLSVSAVAHRFDSELLYGKTSGQMTWTVPAQFLHGWGSAFWTTASEAYEQLMGAGLRVLRVCIMAQ